MVCRAEEAMRGAMLQKHEQKGLPKDNHKQIIQCNKGKSCRFKRSTSSLDDDGASSAILLLACIACSPSITPTHH